MPSGPAGTATSLILSFVESNSGLFGIHAVRVSTLPAQAAIADLRHTAAFLQKAAIVVFTNCIPRRVIDRQQRIVEALLSARHGHKTSLHCRMLVESGATCTPVNT